MTELSKSPRPWEYDENPGDWFDASGHYVDFDDPETRDHIVSCVNKMEAERAQSMLEAIACVAKLRDAYTYTITLHPTDVKWSWGHAALQDALDVLLHESEQP